MVLAVQCPKVAVEMAEVAVALGRGLLQVDCQYWHAKAPPAHFRLVAQTGFPCRRTAPMHALLIAAALVLLEPVPEKPLGCQCHHTASCQKHLQSLPMAAGLLPEVVVAALLEPGLTQTSQEDWYPCSCPWLVHLNSWLWETLWGALVENPAPTRVPTGQDAQTYHLKTVCSQLHLLVQLCLCSSEVMSEQAMVLVWWVAWMALFLWLKEWA